MKNFDNILFNNIFNDLTDLIEKANDKPITDRLEKARELVLSASQQYLLGRSKGVDLTELGVPDDRSSDRRFGDRRHTRVQ